ncbi:anhydro-N-acetylmuramic acid kinase [Pseudomonadota bacterium]
MSSELYIGLMSGTSMDGIDAALIQSSDSAIELIATHSLSWPEDIRQQLQTLATPGDNEIDRLGRLDAVAGDHFAQAALELLDNAGIAAHRVTAIGSHGQTIRHRPQASPPFTLQIGDPNRIAEQTGITTIADFRRRDMAAGGEGAPLVPAFHAYIFQSQDEYRVILNIGGIANLTALPTDPESPIFGFDTGPGNCLLDAWIQRHHKQPYDGNGEWAATGKTDKNLLKRMLDDGYFQRASPKSTGPEYFSLAWLETCLAKFPEIAPADVQATLVTLSANSIAGEILKAAPECQRVLVSGGGVHNAHLMTQLREQLTSCPVTSTEEYGLHPDWVEAAAFAWLAQQTLHGRPGNLPAVTGAKHPVILGGIYPA